ncbi:MAG: DsbA family oxidoreductase [Planctomycetota bacterium]
MPDTQAIRIDFISDVVCPWCIIGYKQLERAVALTGSKADIHVDLHWHPFELNPTMAPEGENLREHLAAKYGTTPAGSKKARERLTRLGAQLGFTFDYADDMRMVNTFRAHQLIHWAGTEGRAHDMKMALFAAFFTHRQDLNDPKVLADCAAQIRLDRREASDVLKDGRFAQSVRGAETMWLRQGIQGVPAIVFEQRYLLTGAQGVETYSAALERIIEQRAA